MNQITTINTLRVFCRGFCVGLRMEEKKPHPRL
nr:MAG TPA: hypothetical protein [Caudoviricetes sp.]